MPTLKLSIHNDPDCQNPSEYGGWKLYSFNRNHVNYAHGDQFFKCVGGKLVLKNTELRRKQAIGTLHIISCYDHSSVQWGLQGEVFQCQWDTAQVAGVLVYEGHANELPRGIDARRQSASSFLREYSEWANGNCFYFSLETEAGEAIDSCGGYIGTTYVSSVIKEAIQGYCKENDLEAEHVTVDVSGDAAWLQVYCVPEGCEII